MFGEASNATLLRFVIRPCMSCFPQELPPRCEPYDEVCRNAPFFRRGGTASLEALFFRQGVRSLKAGHLNYNLYHTAGHKGQAKAGGTKVLGRQPRGRRKKREPGRGHYDKDRPAIIAWVSRQGGVVIQATRDFTVKTVQKAADLAMQAGCVPPFTRGVSTRPMRLMEPGVIRAIPDVRFHASSETPCR